MRILKSLLSAAAALALASPAVTQASVVYELNVPAGMVYGTVTFEQSGANVVHLVAQLADGYNFVDTGAHESFGFNLSSGSAIVTVVTPVVGYTPSYTTFVQPGFGSYHYGLECNTCSGGNNTATPNNQIVLSIASNGLTENSFVANSLGYFFTADIFGRNPTGGSATFAVGATSPSGPPNELPEPTGLALAGLGVGALALVRRRTAR